MTEVAETAAETAAGSRPGGAGAPERVVAPVAKKVPAERVHHGDVVVDPYEWLRDKDDPEVVAYLEAQNAYTEAQTAGLAELRKTVFGEIRSRIRETDMSVPARSGRYWYYTRTREGQQYGVRCRCPIRGDDDWTPPEVTPEQPLPGEEVYFDTNAEAAGHDFFAMGALSVSHDGNWLAYSVDTVGDERYFLRIRNLTTGEDLPDEIDDTAGSAVWSRDAKHLFYLTVDDAWRPDTVWRHEVGAGSAASGPGGDGAGSVASGPGGEGAASGAGSADVKVFHEPDERYWVGIGLSHSEEYLVIGVGSKVTTENYLLRADDPTGEFVSVAPRVEGVEYHVEHAKIGGEDYLLIVHNEERDGVKAINSAIDIAPVGDLSARRELIAHDPARRIEDIDCFRDFLVLSYREDALPRIAIADLRLFAGGGLPGRDDFAEVHFDRELYAVGLAANPEWDTPHLRIGYESFVDPHEVIDLNMDTGERVLLKRMPVLGGYDPDDYVASREWAVADDGTRIPVSLVRRRDTGTAPPDRDGPLRTPAPTLLYGYGSYETSLDPGFSVSRLSLLDRGVVMAYAHVRGGGELGRYWYEDGKLLAKRNSFTDFVAVARMLVDGGWTAPDRLVAEGGSAGGLLMGAVANLAPELFNGVLAVVPFVDALNSILDPSLPLTVIEWDEWGDPLHNADVYEYMKSYTPYENVEARAYPAILALTSLNDTRVLFTEAAKWVARLQECNTSDNPIMLKTEMSAGHGGVSGRYKQWEELSFEIAWILQQTGAVDVRAGQARASATFDDSVGTENIG